MEEHSNDFQVADAYIASEDSYYFQRSPYAFDAIFQYYATGVIHRPPEICPAAFLSELDFWRISHQHVGSCCADILPRDKSEEKEEEKVEYNEFNSHSKLTNTLVIRDVLAVKLASPRMPATK